VTGVPGRSGVPGEGGLNGDNGAAGAGAGGDALRALVREVLADLLPTVPARPATGPAPAVPGLAQPGLAHTVHENVESAETVMLRTDADLDAFVRRLLHLLENPKNADALRAGRLRFRLAPAAVPGSAQPAHRIDSGAVTEAMVRQAAASGARLVLGRRAVLTPLARDRARSAGVQIERER
jgi:hypothetical protein